MMDTAPLIAEITAAFDGIAREDGVSLREGDAIDGCVSDKKRAAARRLDTDTRWQDVSNADLLDYYNSLVYLDAKGFRYYLPAYIVYDLRQSVNYEYGVSGYTLSHLYPPDDGSQWERLRLITPPQGQAISSFLRFVVTHGDDDNRQEAAKYLAGYWNQYCNSDTE